MSKEIKKIIISLTILSLVFVLSPHFLFDISKNTSDIEFSEKEKYNPFNGIDLEAESAYVFDIIRKEEVFELNSDIQLPLASITKVMTAIIAKEQVPPETVITISMEDIEKEGDNNLMVNEKWLLSNIIGFTLAESSNDGASAIASNLEKILVLNNEDIESIVFSEKFPKFIYLMNKKAKELGLEQTFFLNETGLDISKNLSGSYSSASDTAKLMIYALSKHQEIFEMTRYRNSNSYSLNYGEHRIDNTNKHIDNLALIIGSKTGYTDLAGGNLAIIFDAGFNHPIAAVVMGSSIEGRFTDMKKLINATYDWLQQK